ncbi:MULTISPECIES: hypothetical protein [unclassified Neisseria]|uniref:hypothetical protein n=1 Tax=unclassified Neisseria TaxID=2623750 RepID=UPI002666349B|nr:MULTISPECIES: hypothetical protein [unclassified Neisseria]MDO1509275.1 hypothetical protein [Neisseria sp. MVDL19-042950]MDO1515446.1 hypothetical protein [Neisseria sp. MVDL18-041461]MDO1562806.1 hypothetical protein [Neisseria sp. MVDL20-010259]
MTVGPSEKSFSDGLQNNEVALFPIRRIRYNIHFRPSENDFSDGLCESSTPQP